MNIIRVVLILIFALTQVAHASKAVTTRIPAFSNHKVSVWETIIYPSAHQALKMHRHDHDRVVVALDNGVIKVTNKKGKTHLLKLSKNKAYYLPKDIPGELHNDQNMSAHPIRLFVIQLNS